MVKVNGYARFSPRKNAETCESIETQIAYIRKFCAEKGYEIVAIYVDKNKSGDDEDRPGLWEAVTATKKGMFLVVHKIDRLARSMFLIEYIHRELAKHNARLEVVTGMQNGDSPEDVLMRQILTAFFLYEKKIIAARTSAAMLMHQENGRAMSDYPPFGKMAGPTMIVVNRAGVQTERKTWVDNDEEIQHMGQIVALRRAGGSLRKIAAEMNGAGRKFRGKAWRFQTVAKIIKAVAERSF